MKKNKNLAIGTAIGAKFAEDPGDLLESLRFAVYVLEIWYIRVKYLELKSHHGN